MLRLRVALVTFARCVTCVTCVTLAGSGCERSTPQTSIVPTTESVAKSPPSASASPPVAASVTLETLIASYAGPDGGSPASPYEGKLVRVKGKIVERRVDADAGWSTVFLGLPGEEVTLACAFTPVEAPALAVGAEVRVEGKLETRFKFSTKGGPAPDIYLGDCRVVAQE